MKDITKRDIMDVLEYLPSDIKSNKNRISQMMLPSIQNYSGGVGSVYWPDYTGKLQVELRVSRTEKQRKKACGEEWYENEKSR